MHVEHSGKRKRDTTQRLFLYAARLIERYRLPVYPILLTSYDQPRTRESDRYVLEVRGLRVIDFRCRVVQLNRMDWREFVRVKNPAAAALMAKMRIAPEDRVRAKVQILRLLVSMRVNRPKMDLIAGFIDNYLALARKEELEFSAKLDKLKNKKERRDVMELMTSWERKGREEGRREGEVQIIQQQLRAKFGPLDSSLSKKIENLSQQRLKRLASDLLKFEHLRDLERWL